MKRVLLISVLIILMVGLIARALIAWYGLTVTSWWRTPWHNTEVGGKAFSMHQIGWAFDVIPVNASIQNLLAVWPFKYVIESNHVHLQIL